MSFENHLERSSGSTQWVNCTLGEQITLQRGVDITKKVMRNGSIPVISSGGISGYHDTYHAKGPGVVIGRKGTLGTVYFVKEDYWPHDTSLWVKDFKGNNPKFVYYFLKTLDLKRYDVGSANPTLNRNHVHPISVNWPVLKVQREIVGILEALDEKIEINNAINKNLEEVAQAIFKRWFVDFEFPNENGEPYKTSGGEFEESELGSLPKGWKFGLLSELGEIAGGSTPSKNNDEYYTNQGIPWITPKDLSINKNKYISRGQIDITKKGFKNSSTRLLPKGTVLFSSRAPIGYMAISKNEVTTNQGFKSIIPSKHVGSEFIYYLLKYNTDNIESRASGSTFKEISGGEMKRVPVLIPSLDTIAHFNNIIQSSGSLIEKCERENESLVLIRDTVLPKLMSGEIRVSVEQEYAQVVDLPMVAESSEKYSTH
ncbi:MULTISPECIES: restriction endonuclease subunit S [Paenibacillus]|uniref:Type I restriction modification DNA specificity domain-containing protein n=1 Tax=Paenibacillus odorifer TaxID=189426 RepID=A0ABX3GR03_9BACL|nr:restriction endonuclease subunit S [Paenibacillus odorifer]OMD35121.1 hypothetical protein BSO21_09570 [Paenibacillus odorifer]